MTREPDLQLQEGAISSTHSPSDNSPGTAPSSAASDMVRMSKEWAQEKEKKTNPKPSSNNIKKKKKQQPGNKLQLGNAVPLPEWKSWSVAARRGGMSPQTDTLESRRLCDCCGSDRRAHWKPDKSLGVGFLAVHTASLRGRGSFLRICPTPSRANAKLAAHCSAVPRKP